MDIFHKLGDFFIFLHQSYYTKIIKGVAISLVDETIFKHYF